MAVFSVSNIAVAKTAARVLDPDWLSPSTQLTREKVAGTFYPLGDMCTERPQLSVSPFVLLLHRHTFYFLGNSTLYFLRIENYERHRNLLYAGCGQRGLTAGCLA